MYLYRVKIEEKKQRRTKVKTTALFLKNIGVKLAKQRRCFFDEIMNEKKPPLLKPWAKTKTNNYEKNYLQKNKIPLIIHLLRPEWQSGRS